MSPEKTGNDRLLLIGCGILKNEIRHLTEKNQWPLDMVFLDSSLHIDLAKLEKRLAGALDRYQEKNIIVFYGCCHPLMDNILEQRQTFRTQGQNCVDMLLGHALFTDELSKGAFFLFEDWARRWHHVTTKTFGGNLAVTREIFKNDRKYLLGIRTPCSEDFTAEAEAAGQSMEVPVYWMDATLDHLESVLRETVRKKLQAM